MGRSGMPSEHPAQLHPGRATSQPRAGGSARIGGELDEAHPPRLHADPAPHPRALELVESLPCGGWGRPRLLSAQTMRADWLPDTTSGRMLADYISVHYAAGRPLVAWVLASEPVGSSLRQAVYATRG